MAVHVFSIFQRIKSNGHPCHYCTPKIHNAAVGFGRWKILLHPLPSRSRWLGLGVVLNSTEGDEFFSIDRSGAFQLQQINSWTPKIKDSSEQPTTQLLVVGSHFRKTQLSNMFSVKWSDIRITIDLQGFFEFWLGTQKKGSLRTTAVPRWKTASPSHELRAWGCPASYRNPGSG